jgi:hypothetical protein
MTLNLSSSCIVMVIRSVAAIKASRAGTPAAGQLTLRKSGHLNLAKSGHYNLASTAAKADWNIYVKSHGDGKGRTLRTRKQIEALLNVAGETCAECNGASLPRAQCQNEDATGCNWYVDIDSDTADNCSKCLLSAIIALQAAYNLTDKIP